MLYSAVASPISLLSRPELGFALCLLTPLTGSERRGEFLQGRAASEFISTLAERGEKPLRKGGPETDKWEESYEGGRPFMVAGTKNTIALDAFVTASQRDDDIPTRGRA